MGCRGFSAVLRSVVDPDSNWIRFSNFEDPDPYTENRSDPHR